jgi:hypothetical protein
MEAAGSSEICEEPSPIWQYSFVHHYENLKSYAD